MSYKETRELIKNIGILAKLIRKVADGELEEYDTEAKQLVMCQSLAEIILEQMDNHGWKEVENNE